jgi:hypothetical protein
MPNYFHIERTQWGTWMVVELWPEGLTRGPFGTEIEARERELRIIELEGTGATEKALEK